MHLKPTAGCQISILIFGKKMWRRGPYEYPIKIFHAICIGSPPNPNIKVDI
jgi:hypothetical protein